MMKSRLYRALGTAAIAGGLLVSAAAPASAAPQPVAKGGVPVVGELLSCGGPLGGLVRTALNLVGGLVGLEANCAGECQRAAYQRPVQQPKQQPMKQQPVKQQPVKK